VDDSTRAKVLTPREQLVTSLTDSLREMTIRGDVEGGEVALEALKRLLALSKRSAETPTGIVTPIRPSRGR
jgi:hypothetical protein